MKTTTSTRAKSLLKQYHTVCTVNGLSAEDKDAILAGYGVESSKDLNESQLSEVINRLNQKADKWRKRVLAAIGAWLKIVNKVDNLNVIKAIACNATGYDNFNRIPISRLRDIYYEFSKKAKTSAKVENITSDIIQSLELQN